MILRADHSIRRAIICDSAEALQGSFQIALRINQEIGRDDDLIAAGHAFGDFRAAAAAPRS